MSEGTKLGELKEGAEFQSPVEEVSPVAVGEFKATKLGELSEFEKSLFLEAVQMGSPQLVSSKENTTSVAQSSAPQEKKSEFSDGINRLVVTYNEGDVINGIVRHVEKSGVLVDIGYKSDGFISNIEFSNEPDITPTSLDIKPGDEIRAYIEKLESKEGYTILSRKRAEYETAWNTISQLVKSKETLEIKVTSKVEGGLVGSYMGIKGFIPASQVLKEGESDLTPFLNQTLEVGVLQADRKKRKIIFTRRTSRTRSQKEAIEKALETLEVGQVKTGKVSSIKDFGAFIDLGGVEGLVHISELSWVRVPHPSDILKVGDEVKVFVLGVDRDHSKVSLGMKQLEQDPWVNVTERYVVDQVVEGTVTRIVTFGAFVKVAEHLEGLIHISELSSKRVSKVEDVVTVGQTVTAKIIKLNPSEQRIGLSLKKLEASDSIEAASQETVQA